MVRRLGVDIEGGVEHQSLIELSGNGQQQSSRQLGTSLSSNQPSKAYYIRLFTFLLLLLVVAYHLGLQQGKSEVYDENDVEDVEKKKQPWHSEIIPGLDDSEDVTKDGEPGPTDSTEQTKEDEDPGPTPAPKETADSTEQTKEDEEPGPTPAPKDGEEAKEETTENEEEEPPKSWIPEPNPFVSKFNTTEWTNYLKGQWEARAKNAIDIHDKYGTYCPKEPAEPMCPELNNLDEKGNPVIGISDHELLARGPTVKCIDTGNKEQRCGVGSPWVNKTIWPLIRGPFCSTQDSERKKRFPMPAELAPYFELGYDRNDPTKSKYAEPFDGGSNDDNSLLSFDPVKVKEHFLKFEAMLEHHYEGLARPVLERNLAPMPESPLYAPMLKAYADQIARVLLRSKEKGNENNKVVVGVLGDSGKKGQCYLAKSHHLCPVEDTVLVYKVLTSILSTSLNHC